MTDRSTQHATFVVERTYDASPARVFAAWADPAAKAQWFGGPDDWERNEYKLDFRVGGREFNRGNSPGEPVYTYDALYADIVPDQRIVYTYTMHRDETQISVSVTTVEFKPADIGTRLVFTEQGVFLDGGDEPEYRERGTRNLLESLDAALSGVPANAQAR